MLQTVSVSVDSLSDLKSRISSVVYPNILEQLMLCLHPVNTVFISVSYKIILLHSSSFHSTFHQYIWIHFCEKSAPLTTTFHRQHQSMRPFLLGTKQRHPRGVVSWPSPKLQGSSIFYAVCFKISISAVQAEKTGNQARQQMF